MRAKWRALDNPPSSHNVANDDSNPSSNLSISSRSQRQNFPCPNPSNNFLPVHNSLDGGDLETPQINLPDDKIDRPNDSRCRRSFSSSRLLHLHLFEDHSELSREQRQRGINTVSLSTWLFDLDNKDDSCQIVDWSLLIHSPSHSVLCLVHLARSFPLPNSVWMHFRKLQSIIQHQRIKIQAYYFSDS